MIGSCYQLGHGRRKSIQLIGIRCQCGSALTECIVLMLAMLPLLAGIPMLGKLVDVKNSSINASRYSAWEETISPDGSVAPFVNQRFFKDSEAPIVTRSIDVEENSLWGSDQHSASGLMVDTRIAIEDNSAGLNSTDGEAPAIVTSLGTGIEKAGEVLAGFSGTQWELTGSGFRRAEVSARIKTNNWFSRALSGCTAEANCIHAKNTIMVDGWSSSEDAQAAARVRSLVPATVLKPVGRVLSTLGRIPLLKELRPIDKSFGYVNMDAMPEGSRVDLPGYRGSE